MTKINTKKALEHKEKIIAEIKSRYFDVQFSKRLCCNLKQGLFVKKSFKIYTLKILNFK